MVHGENSIPYRIDRRLTGLAGPDYDAAISFGLPFELGDSQYGEYIGLVVVGEMLAECHSQVSQRVRGRMSTYLDAFSSSRLRINRDLLVRHSWLSGTDLLRRSGTFSLRP